MVPTLALPDKFCSFNNITNVHYCIQYVPEASIKIPMREYLKRLRQKFLNNVTKMPTT